MALRERFGPTAIISFTGGNHFLANAFPLPLVLEGITFPTAEHAFQAQKAGDEISRRAIASALSVSGAMEMGRLLIHSATPKAAKAWNRGGNVVAMRKVLEAKVRLSRHS